MFNLHDYTMNMIMGYVGKIEDSQVREMSLIQLDKGRLNEDDLAVIDNAIEENNKPIEVEEVEE